MLLKMDQLKTTQEELLKLEKQLDNIITEIKKNEIINNKLTKEHIEFMFE